MECKQHFRLAKPYGLADQKLCYIHMPLNVEKSRQLDKEHSKEWLVNTDPDFSNLLQQGINNTGLRFAPTSPLHDFKVAARKCDQRHFPWYHNKRMFLSLHPVYLEKGTSYRSTDSLQRRRECKDFREKSSHSATSPTRCHCRCMVPVPRRQR